VTVQNNKLIGSINGQQVVERDDSLNPSSAVVGLVAVWHNKNSKTKVAFSDFELDL
jgi:hypothetical protein